MINGVLGGYFLIVAADFGSAHHAKPTGRDKKKFLEENDVRCCTHCCDAKRSVQ